MVSRSFGGRYARTTTVTNKRSIYDRAKEQKQAPSGRPPTRARTGERAAHQAGRAALDAHSIDKLRLPLGAATASGSSTERRRPQRPRDGLRGASLVLRRANRQHARSPVMILPQVHLRKPCYDFYFL